MRKNVTLMTVEHLSEKTRERAYSDWLGNSHYYWGGENLDTLKAFEGLFPIKIKDWKYDSNSGDISMKFTGNDYHADMSGIRLFKHLMSNYYTCMFSPKYLGHVKGKARYSKIQRDNSCVLTGYHIDHDILEPLYAFLKRPYADVTFAELLQSCLDSWVDACVSDVASHETEEAFIEASDANDRYYLPDGTYCPHADELPAGRRRGRDGVG